MQSEKMWLIVPRTIVYKMIFLVILKKGQKMNKLIPISIEYISPSRTLEILNLVRFEESKQVYVYNYDGQHFRVFENLVELIQFFQLGKEPAYLFDSNDDLDEFLEQIPLGPIKKPLNLKMNYMYRDGANYKQFGYVIFKKASFLTPNQASQKLKEKLISNEFFIPQDWGLPRLQKYAYDPEIDHEWHEFESFEWTDEDVTDNRDLSSFLDKIQKGYEI